MKNPLSQISFHVGFAHTEVATAHHPVEEARVLYSERDIRGFIFGLKLLADCPHLIANSEKNPAILD